MKEKRQVFISYSGDDAFEASLLKYAIETELANQGVIAWIFKRDQNRSEKDIAKSLKEKVKKSIATIFLISPTTIDSGATQWMELAYSDAFDVKTYVLLHHISYKELRSKERGVPPLILSSQCNLDIEWQEIIDDIKKIL